MQKFSRSRALDPVQESLREQKALWNNDVKLFINNLINIKRTINGSPSKFFQEKSKITQPIPSDPVKILNSLAEKYQEISLKGLEIVQKQNEYSASRLKQASNPLSRTWSKFKGPLFHHWRSSDEAKEKSVRLSLLDSFLKCDRILRSMKNRSSFFSSNQDYINSINVLVKSLGSTISFIKSVMNIVSYSNEPLLPSNNNNTQQTVVTPPAVATQSVNEQEDEEYLNKIKFGEKNFFAINASYEHYIQLKDPDSELSKVFDAIFTQDVLNNLRTLFAEIEATKKPHLKNQLMVKYINLYYSAYNQLKQTILANYPNVDKSQLDKGLLHINEDLGTNQVKTAQSTPNFDLSAIKKEVRELSLEAIKEIDEVMDSLENSVDIDYVNEKYMYLLSQYRRLYSIINPLTYGLNQTSPFVDYNILNRPLDLTEEQKERLKLRYEKNQIDRFLKGLK